MTGISRVAHNRAIIGQRAALVKFGAAARAAVLVAGADGIPSDIVAHRRRLQSPAR